MKTWKQSKFVGIMVILALALALVACDNSNGTGHTHDYGTAWKSNATQHWKECSCAEKTGVPIIHLKLEFVQFVNTISTVE